MYYFKCMIAGVLSCGLTHTAVCPLDVIKCNMQVRTGPTAPMNGEKRGRGDSEAD